MTGLLRNVRFRIGAAVAALAVAGAVGAFVAPPGPSRHTTEQAQKVVVGRAALGCPALGAANGTSTSVDAVSPVLPDGTPIAGGKISAVALRKLGSDDPASSVRQRGRMATVKQGASPAGVSVRAMGPLAAGTTATATSVADSGVNRGMASTVCSTPTAEFWFTGASSASGRRDVLVLTNLDEANASVDVTFLGATGALENTGGRGIVVQGRSQAEVFLKTVVPGQRELGLRVVSTGGRVSAALRDNVSSGPSPAGVDWLPPSAEPSQQVLVPAVAPGPGARVLTVANPGELQATVTVTVLGARGPYKPAGHETVEVPAGGVTSVRLDEALRGEAAALSLSAEQPVFASMRIVDAKNTDFAAVGSALPLTGPGYLALPAHSEPATVLVSAPGDRGTADVTVRTATGDVALRKTVVAAAGSTVAVQLPANKQQSYVTVSPHEDGGQVVAGVTLTPPAKGKGPEVRRVAAWPVTTSLVFRAQLGAHPDTHAALRPN